MKRILLPLAIIIALTTISLVNRSATADSQRDHPRHDQTRIAKRAATQGVFVTASLEADDPNFDPNFCIEGWRSYSTYSSWADCDVTDYHEYCASSGVRSCTRSVICRDGVEFMSSCGF